MVEQASGETERGVPGGFDGVENPAEGGSVPTLSSERRTRRVVVPDRSVRVAYAHGWLRGAGEPEVVLDRLIRVTAERFVPGSLYVLGDSGKPVTGAIDSLTKVVSSVGRLPGGEGFRRSLLPLHPWAVEDLSGKLAREHASLPVDLLISSSSGLIKGMRPPEGARHLCYCHAPMAALWDPGSGEGGLGVSAFGGWLRGWDRRTVANVDQFLANSRHTAREIERAWGRESVVVPPPVRTDFFTVDEAVRREEFWLVVASLQARKRVDLAIEAAMRTGRRLMIVGTGPLLGKLKADAKKSARVMGKAGLGTGRHKLLEFMGRVPQETLRDLYRRAAVFVMPQVEGFGVAAAEAQACGCPVVARRAGGALDVVLEGRTGVFFDEPDSEQLRAAVERVPEGVAEQCRAHAEQFDVLAFDRRVDRAVDSLLRTRPAM